MKSVNVGPEDKSKRKVIRHERQDVESERNTEEHREWDTLSAHLQPGCTKVHTRVPADAHPCTCARMHTRALARKCFS